MYTNFLSSLPVAILPGLMCDSRMFGAQVRAGAIVVDGFYGRADRLSDMAEYALSLIPERSVLIGHSMGARVALEVLRRAPDRVDRLVLANTGVHPVGPGEREKRYALRDLGRDQGIAALVDAWLPPMLGNAAKGDTDLCASLRAMCIDAGIATYEAQIEALLARPDVGVLLGAISCPTLSLTGAEDLWSPPSQHEDIAAAIPGCALRVAPGAGHMLPAEKPENFNAMLNEWLAETTV